MHICNINKYTFIAGMLVSLFPNGPGDQNNLETTALGDRISGGPAFSFAYFLLVLELFTVSICVLLL